MIVEQFLSAEVVVINDQALCVCCRLCTKKEMQCYWNVTWNVY